VGLGFSPIRKGSLRHSPGLWLDSIASDKQFALNHRKVFKVTDDLEKVGQHWAIWIAK